MALSEDVAVAGKKQGKKESSPAEPKTKGSPPAPKKPESPELEPTPDELAESRPGPSGPAVVGIGASAGGLDAFKKFFGAMPADSGVAFVLVPHLDPGHESLMVELIGRHSSMPVVEARNDMPVEANHIYIIPPNKYLTIEGGSLQLTGPVDRRASQTSIDMFLRSLAEDQQERAICIILSGTGASGVLGLKAVKAAGGMTMVQDPKTAEYDRMPQSAIATGLADYVLPPEKMPEAIIQFVQHAYLNGGTHIVAVPEAADMLTQMLALIRARTRFDFRWYRKKMLIRRIERRMGLNHFDRVSDYMTFLRDHQDELELLIRDLFISVTSFFRDPEAFETLATQVIDPLVHQKEATDTIRVWVPGCATGEEPYSLGMLILERLAAAKKNCKVQIFATDVDGDALEVARQGNYSEASTADISPARLAHFFTKMDDQNYQVGKQLREPLIFAVQNLISDAPFTKLDLISCRNLLIYLEPEVQKKVITLFHFALHERGYLFLGSSETIGRQIDLFEPISKKWRIYQRIGVSRPDRVDLPIAPQFEGRIGPRRPSEPVGTEPINFPQVAQRLLLEQFAPAAVLINRKYEILYYFGPCSLYLELPTGAPTHDVIEMAREGLQTKLRGAIHRAIRQNEIVVVSDLRVKRVGGYASVRITIRPVQMPKAAEGLMMITFEDQAAPAASAPPGPAEKPEGGEEATVRQLEFELKATREDLQSTIEEMESSNEELKASNEEVMSMNEELQSANEELETSKEELQSLNEELTTVNNQLQEKVSELESAQSDLANLLNCTDIGTIFLDTKLRIKRYTPAVNRLFNLIPSDIGRPISDITHHLNDPELIGDAQKVLQQLVPREKEVSTADNARWVRRIIPYRTIDNRIEGVVVTLSDVTLVKRASEKARLLATVLKNSNDAIIVHEFDGRITGWNGGAERLYGYTEAEALQMSMDRLTPKELQPEVHAIWQKLERGQSLEGWQTRRLGKDGRLLDISVMATRLTDGTGRAVAITTIDRDITEMKQTQAALEKAVEARTAELRHQEQQLRAIYDNTLGAIISIDSEGVIQSANRTVERIFGYAAEEMVGHNIKMLAPSSTRPYDGFLQIFRETGEGETVSNIRELRAQRKDGSPIDIALCVTRLEGMDRFIGILLDVTRRKQLERDVVEIATMEQQRIGENLHDDCGQELTAMGLLVDSLIHQLESQAPEPLELARKLEQGIRRVHRQVRGISRGLALTTVEPRQLSSTLAELVGNLGEISGIRCVFKDESVVVKLNTTQATHLYHIAQEACTNAIKHSGAKNLEIRFQSDDAAVILQVRDDGRGIPDDAREGSGQRIMRNRANLIGAKLTIDTMSPQGTMVTCALSTPQGGTI